jgi:O-antigen/teichoic acid export membrane protein
MFPTFSKIQTDLAGLRERYLKVLKYLSHISIPAGVGLAVVSRTFVLGVLGSDWSAAVAPLEIFSVVGILGSLTSPAASIFLATGNPDKMFRQTWVTSAMYFVFLVPAIFYWELVGVAALFLFGAIASLVWVLLMVAEILRFSLADELRMLIVPVAASAIMAVLTFGVGILMGSTMLSLGIQVMVAIPAYFVCVFLMTKGEIVREVKALLASARSK